MKERFENKLQKRKKTVCRRRIKGKPQDRKYYSDCLSIDWTKKDKKRSDKEKHSSNQKSSLIGNNQNNEMYDFRI